MPQNYNDTIHKMATPFEMRAGLPKKEPKMLEDWEKNHVYEKMIEHNADLPRFVLHDGPPYANGNIHMGTALNKIIKDIIIREKNMSGYCAPYVPGYDTHGLPIELKALSSLGDKKAGISKLELRKICKEFATEHIDVMNSQFARLGVQGDFANPYLTLRPEFEARQVEIFGEMAKKGYIYKGMKAVYWCPEDRTALAEAEIEYAEDECDSIYVRFKLTDDPNGVLAKYGIPLDKAWIVIWTTTTWTLPANVATCLNPSLEYAFVKIGDEYHLMAAGLVESTMKACHIEDYEVLEPRVLGSEFELMQYQHPFLDRKGLVILGDHVTLEGGTGCVHTAPGHGVEDFEVCVNHYPQVPVIVPVDDGGYLTEEAGKEFAGLKVWAANKVILEHIKQSGHLMGVQHITHQYPHCWRCHHPIIFRATEQWFCSIDKFREEAYKAIDEVKWQPAWGHDRMHGMVRDRSDWCISRQRVWGVPIPVFYCKNCGKYHITDASIKAVSDLFRKEGSDAWYKYDANEIMPKTEVCECGASDWEKDPDIMDVWFDSGSTWSAVCREADWRVLGLKPYPVQIIGGIVLHRSCIAEMQTGEGKTLVATMPVYLNALTGEGVHVVTVNDYLAKRDSEWMGKVYRFLGLTVGLVIHDVQPQDRRKAYLADVTYGTNNEFGFDYLRDNMVVYKASMVQRGHAYAIVDEVDSILIDEARTPLIISGKGEDSSVMYKRADDFAKTLKKSVIVELDDKVEADEQVDGD